MEPWQHLLREEACGGSSPPEEYAFMVRAIFNFERSLWGVGLASCSVDGRWVLNFVHVSFEPGSCRRFGQRWCCYKLLCKLVRGFRQYQYQRAHSRKHPHLCHQ